MQVPINLLHPVFDRSVKLSETLEAVPSILLLVEELRASARCYYGAEKHYQPVLEIPEHNRGRDCARTFCWTQQIYHRLILGGKLGNVLKEYAPAEPASFVANCVSCSCYVSALQGSYGLVLVGELKDQLDELAQPEALKYFDQLWGNCFESMHSQWFAASFILELLGPHMR